MFCCQCCTLYGVSSFGIAFAVYSTSSNPIWKLCSISGTVMSFSPFSPTLHPDHVYPGSNIASIVTSSSYKYLSFPSPDTFPVTIMSFFPTPLFSTTL